MINLTKLFKDYNDAGPLNEYINLYGFADDQVFLTKSGDLGVVVHVDGIDHECLDPNVTSIFCRLTDSLDINSISGCPESSLVQLYMR